MNTFETKSVRSDASTDVGSNGPPATQVEPPRRSGAAKFVLILLMGGAAAGAVYAYSSGTDKVHRDIDRTISYLRRYFGGAGTQAKPKEIKSRRPWDGLVRVAPAEARNHGLLVVTVQPQVEPIKLELPGRTAYDPNSLTKIRPRFDTLVEKVYVELGETVKKGQPLLELFSTDLAAAKNEFQTAYVQWQHDLTLRTHREALIKGDAISGQALIDSRNDENKSRLAVTTARQKLLVYKVPEEQIDPLIKNLNPNELPDKDAILSVIDKAKMTSRSPVDGRVIVREVVPGNFYDTNDVLMVIAPLDHLIIWLNAYEADQSEVAVGQHMAIQFPYLDRTILGVVQYVAAEVSRDTRTIRIRASVPNVTGELKADMLVKASLDIPPVKGQAVIPRSAVVVMNGHEYAFIRKPPTGPNADERFERRKLVIAEERADHVVVASGTAAGEEVVSYGSLILAQLFEDQQTVATGMPLQ